MTDPATLLALSPLDGRYAAKLDALRPIFSEYGLMRERVHVEIEWLKALAADPRIAEVPEFSPQTLRELELLVEEFKPSDAAAIKAIEARTNHDVKAVEYWIKERLEGLPEAEKAR